MSIQGITTTIIQSPITEKVADNIDRAAQYQQQASAVAAQQHAEERTKVVQSMDKVDTIGVVKRKEEQDDTERKKQKKEKKKQGSGFKSHLDLKA